MAYLLDRSRAASWHDGGCQGQCAALAPDPWPFNRLVLGHAGTSARRRGLLETRVDAPGGVGSDRRRNCVPSYAQPSFWPYVWLHPYDGVLWSYASMSSYDWAHVVRYGGESISALRLPRSYSLTWLWIASPPVTILFAAAGAAIVVVDAVRGRLQAASGLVLAAAIVPVSAIVALQPTLYNGLRHFLFVIPPLALLAALAVTRAWQTAGRSSRGTGPLRGALAFVLVAGTAQVGVEIGRLYPYEYLYFGPQVGGFSAAGGDYEADYWHVCSSEASRWLGANWRTYVPVGDAKVLNGNAPSGMIEPYLPAELIAVDGRARFGDVIGTVPDFAIWTRLDRPSASRVARLHRHSRCASGGTVALHSKRVERLAAAEVLSLALPAVCKRQGCARGGGVCQATWGGWT